MSSAIRNAKKKGIILIHSISYPVIVSVRNFADWDKSAFGADNSLVSVPNKAEVRKAIREGLIHLTLATMLSDGQLGSDPSVEEVSVVYKRVEKNISRMLPSSKSIEERDGILSRAYVRALKDYSRRNTGLKKFLDKNKQYLEVSKRKSAKSSTKKGRSATENRKMKAQIKMMIKEGDIRKLSNNPKDVEQFVNTYLSSASLSQSKAKTESTKKKARSNRRKLMKSIKK